MYQRSNEPCHEKTNFLFCFFQPGPTETLLYVQLKKMARVLKFWIKKVEVLFYLCGENEGADPFSGYREADLPLCFRICEIRVFSYVTQMYV